MHQLIKLIALINIKLECQPLCEEPTLKAENSYLLAVSSVGKIV
jgi:hypothetical protein